MTKTDGIRTLVTGDKAPVDASVKKLLAELRRAEIEKWHAERRIQSIHAALKIIGVKPEGAGAAFHGDGKEMDYTSNEPFKNLPLAEACEWILRDYKGHWLTRSQVEYLATRGGFDFSTKDVSNSVDVTLRRLAASGRIEAERVRGSRGSKYRAIMRFPREEAKGKAAEPEE